MRLNELLELEGKDISSPPLPEDELIYYKDYIGMKSKLLNETIILCINESKLKEIEKLHPNNIIYLPHEIKELAPYKDDEDIIKWVHACKKEFGSCAMVPKDKQTFRFSDLETEK